MKKEFLFFALVMMVPLLRLQCQNNNTDPWSPGQLIKPAELAVILKSAEAKPLIFNVGPMNNIIKGAVRVGATSAREGLEKLKTELSGVPKDKTIVVYCGCCTSQNCPNVRPAFELLKQLGYKKIRCLEIEHGFQEDWAGKDYPME